MLTRHPLFLLTAATIGLLVALGLIPLLTNGLPARMPAEVVAIAAVADQRSPRREECFARTPAEIARRGLCILGDPTPGLPPDTLLWGDSHADALAPGIDLRARGEHAALYFAGDAACPPLLDLARPRDTKGRCARFNDAVLGFLREHPGVTKVLLVGRWAMVAEGTRFADEGGDEVAWRDRRGEAEGGHAVFVAGLRRTLESLTDSGREVWLLAQVPEVPFRVPEALALARLRGLPPPAGADDATYLQRQAFVMQTLGRFERQFGIHLLYPHQLLCDTTRPTLPCAIALDGHPLYRDAHHLSVYGSEVVSQMVTPLLNAGDRTR